MIRMFLFATGFLVITIALLVLQPGAPDPARDAPIEVTRAEADFDLADRPAPAIQPTAMPHEAAMLPASETDTLDEAGLRRLTWTTLANLNAATGHGTAPGQPGSLLHTIVQRSLDARSSGIEAGEIFGQYLVQPGDSLVSIANAVYGDANMTGPLFSANADLLQRPEDLRAGQMLRLPVQ